MATQAEKGVVLRALHEREKIFVIPNPWDAGSARMLQGLGFEALATTSSGFAYTTGQLDYEPGRDAVLEHAAAMAAVTDVPISGDLEDGFGAAPETAAETIRLAAQAGLVGGSIEDSKRDRDEPLYDIEHAADRVRAAVEAAKSLDFPFVLTARAENFIVGRPDLADAICRLQAYQEAGAEVLFAPGLASREDIATVVKSIDRPLNVIIGIPGLELTLGELEELGVRRVSTGSLLTRAALGGFLSAARELLDGGTYDFAKDAARSKDLASLLRSRAS